VLVAAAICPHPPLLIAALAGGGGAAGPDVEALRVAAAEAVARLLAAGTAGTAADEAGPAAVVVAGTGPVAGAAAPDATGSLAGYGADITVGLGATATGSRADGTVGLGAGLPAGNPTLPLPVTAGVWLLRSAGYRGTIRGRVLTEFATPAECVSLGARIAAFPGRTALLIMGDGSARREARAPGHVDARAVPFDDVVTAALAGADTATLAGLDPDLARELLVSGRGPWQLLAGAAATGRWQSELLHASAPFGVAYRVAYWSRA
jgi:hypothetical protein